MKRILPILIPLLMSCGGETPETETNIKIPAFGSSIDIKYLGEPIEGFTDTLNQFLNQFNASLSTYDPHSLVCALNTNTTDSLDDLNYQLINRSLELQQWSGGAFDITVAPLVDLWGFGKDTLLKIPDSMHIDSALALCGDSAVYLLGRNLVKRAPGVRLNYNAIAPGYAADLIAQKLIALGKEDFYINVGGEIRCMGVNRNGSPWTIGIEKPQENVEGTNPAMRYLGVKNQAIATSGNYRRFYVKEGKKYAHTIDPRTGYPVQHDLLSATILAPDAATADALATACMVLGMDEAKKMLAKVPGVSYYFVYTDSSGGYHEEFSPGLETQFVNID